jgi:sirohydrochlorin cobaltochelatase
MRDTTSALKDWLARGGQHIGQVLILRAAEGWDLRHIEDAGRTDLPPSSRWQDARAIANLDAAGAYRPLKTAPTLRRGWQLLLSSAEDVRRALDYLYPAMLGMHLAHQAGEVTPLCLRETLGRQTGMYRVTQKLSEAQAQDLIGRTCRDGACLKKVLWRIAPEIPIESLPAEKFDTAPSPDRWPLLCPEACNLVVAEARRVVKGEAA